MIKEYHIYVRSKLQHTLLLYYLYEYLGFQYLSFGRLKMDNQYWCFNRDIGAITININKNITGGQQDWGLDKCDFDVADFIDNHIWIFNAVNMGVL